MPEPIDPLSAASHAAGEDAIDVAVGIVARLVEVRDMVVRGRAEDPATFPAFGSTEPPVIGRRTVAALLDAGWRPPSDEQVSAAADRYQQRKGVFRAWLDGLDPHERARALEYFATTNEWPSDLLPPG